MSRLRHESLPGAMWLIAETPSGNYLEFYPAKAAEPTVSLSLDDTPLELADQLKKLLNENGVRPNDGKQA